MKIRNARGARKKRRVNDSSLMEVIFSVLPSCAGLDGSETRPYVLLLIDDAIFHNKFDVFGNADVFERIAGNGNDIGEVAGLQSTDLILPAEELRAVEEIGLQGGDRRHAELDHQFEFAGLRAMRKG